ncbi:MAG TPA: DinB family protein [Chitinophagaceae bacterium]|nr:DinB family protein [Chitinophagaceae bacterium]
MPDSDYTRAEAASLSKQLSDFYNGDSWVTYNLHRRIFSLDSAIAFKKLPQHHHCIAEQLQHITSWRNFAVQRLTGNNSFDIADNSISDWPQGKDWGAIKNDFLHTHYALLKAIADFDNENWILTVPGRNYSFLFLLKGVVHHDYYHYGQMTSLLAVLDEE